jgi:hypothetical protein
VDKIKYDLQLWMGKIEIMRHDIVSFKLCSKLKIYAGLQKHIFVNAKVKKDEEVNSIRIETIVLENMIA